ncbi:L-threonylcarbamoyladenylate synthase [Candidatus Amarolinea aalborgensis]|jgi:L-threonylcarbamoyladenylate synthase|uniref:L-threonylcarbamoyladenylate synthase n=1 Tax=Candidatus Amarolinea aalborgensis TaxID=2249329 RepID=UPI003BFA1411
MQTRVISADRPGALAQAVAVLRAGGLVAFPTDTVYGVGAHAYLPAAIARLYTAKVRPEGKAIPLLLGDAADIERVSCDLPPLTQRLMDAFWPGALTLVVPRNPELPDIVTAGGPTVAVRLPDHPVPRALARALGAPLAATSANLSGQAEAASAADVMAQLAGRIDLLLDGGRCPGGVPSSVVDLTVQPPVILRQGALDPGLLQRLLAAR